MAANISTRLPCVSNARKNANNAAKIVIMPSRALTDDTKLSTTIEMRGSKDAATVARMEMPVCKCDSEYCDISERGSVGRGFCEVVRSRDYLILGQVDLEIFPNDVVKPRYDFISKPLRENILPMSRTECYEVSFILITP